MSEKGVCVAVKAKLSKDSGVGKGIDFDHIVEKLQDKPKAKGKDETFLQFSFQIRFIIRYYVLEAINSFVNYILSSNRRIAYFMSTTSVYLIDKYLLT